MCQLLPDICKSLIKRDYLTQKAVSSEQRCDLIFSDFTDQLHLLADAFNKYEVTNTAMSNPIHPAIETLIFKVNETTCQLYVACESAHAHLHEKHGKLAKIVHQVDT